MQLSRRKFTVGSAIALTAGVAGCSSEGTNDNSGGSGGGGNSEPQTQTETITDTTRDVQEDEYVYMDFTLPRQGQLEYDFLVRDGPEIELWVMPSDEFTHLQAGERFQYNGGGSGASDQGTLTLNSGDYVIVLDNTETGEISPPTNFDDDIASVEIEATMTY